MAGRRDFGDVVDRITSVAAIVTAAAAVGIGVYQAHITREQQKKSAWPYLFQANAYDFHRYERIVENRGLGPALVRSFRVEVGDSVYDDWPSVVHAVLGHDPQVIVRSSFHDGMVLLPGHQTAVLTLPDSADARAFEARDTALHTTVCYCSLYDDCWVFGSRDRRPRPVDDCSGGGD